MAEPLELILAVETATRAQSVAVLRGEAPRVELAADPGRGGSETLLPLIDAALREAGARLADVEAFAVSVGPGSFTGLRIGLATLKGLAFGSERPAVAVPTLLALAETAAAAGAGGGCLAPLLDARRGELYAAAYAPDAGAASGWREALRPGVYTPAALAAGLPRPCTLVGEEAALAAMAGVPDLGRGPALPPRAGAVGRLGARLLRAGHGGPAAALVPRYLRRAEAEVKRTGQRFERDSTLP